MNGQHIQHGDTGQRNDLHLGLGKAEQSEVSSSHWEWCIIENLWTLYLWNFSFNIFGSWWTTGNWNRRKQTRVIVLFKFTLFCCYREVQFLCSFEIIIFPFSISSFCFSLEDMFLLLPSLVVHHQPSEEFLWSSLLFAPSVTNF